MNSIPAKDVIYIDVDDEITAIIDKVRTSQSKIVALVLPKRATTLQSIVNMKLLKRSADADKKHLVLISSEVGLMPLAAATGVYVAKNLQSKPEIPEANAAAAELPEDLEESVTLEDEPLNKNTSVGDLARTRGAAGAVVSPSAQDLDAPIELDNTTAPKPSASGVIAGARDDGKKDKKTPFGGKKDKSLKVPNFNNFRKWLMIGGAALVVLVFGLYLALGVMPKANVLVKTDSQAIDSSVQLSLNTKASKVDADMGIAPAKSQEMQKTYSQQAPATGQKNNGQKASGNITVINCNDDTVTLPAGTGFSSGSNTFISRTSISIPGSNFKSGGDCKNDGKEVVSVVAQNGGASYNIGATNYSIANSPSKLSASGDAMTGGTDDITKIIQQSDIDAAKQKITSQDTSDVKKQLQSQLNSAGYFPIVASFTSEEPAVSASASVGDAAENVTVTEKVTHTMYGAKKADLEKIVKDSVKDNIDTSKQSILDYGIDGANYSTPSPIPNGVSTTMQVTVVAGPDIDAEVLAKQVLGKKSGEAKSIIKNYPGVTDVEISYSPFWVTKMPGKANKITITIDKPQTRTNAK